MQLQRSALAIGGRASEAAQSVPTVGQLGNSAAGDGNKTIVVSFLEIHVHDST